MLPIRWTLPVGGVFLAIALLALVFNAPGESRLQISNVVLARSGIIEWGERPEWRQYVILSGIQRRADELSKLRDLPDTPDLPDTSINTDVAPADSKIAGLPQTVPLDIADPLSIEFPVSAAPEEDPKAAPAEIVGLPHTDPLDTADSLSIEFPVSAAPKEKPKSRNQARRKSVRHVRHRVTAGNQETPQAQNVVGFPFGSQTGSTLPLNQSGQAATPKANNYFGNQTWQTPTPNADIY